MKSHDPGSSDLDARELARYGRHLVLPEVGVPGQRRLRDASVLVVATASS
jgi:adenylyltransferase/sulfurtransferase